jgi:hypothetical protein
VREPQSSNKVSVFQPPHQTTPFLNPVHPSFLPLHSSLNSSKLLPPPPPPQPPPPPSLPITTEKLSCNPFKTSSKRNLQPNLGFPRKPITILLLEIAIEEKGEVGVEAEIGIEKEIQGAGGEVGVERDIVDIVIVIEMLIKAEAIRMVIGVEIGGKGKKGEGGVEVEVFLPANNIGLR